MSFSNAAMVGAGMLICVERGVDLHIAQLIPLPLTVLLQEIQIGFGFTFLVLAHPGSHGQNPESRKMVVVVIVVMHILKRVVHNCSSDS